MIPLDHRDRGNRADPYTEPNSCFSDSSDSLNSLNSLNSMKVPLHLEKTPLGNEAEDLTLEFCATMCTFCTWIISGINRVWSQTGKQ